MLSLIFLRFASGVFVGNSEKGTNADSAHLLFMCISDLQLRVLLKVLCTVLMFFQMTCQAYEILTNAINEFGIGHSYLYSYLTC